MCASSQSTHSWSLTQRDFVVLAVVVLTSGLVYLGLSIFSYRAGFPLDDAWIHATYARNLALHGEWSFLPGQPSAGSTSPLWTFLLAAGAWLGLSPIWWAFLLGAVLLFGICALFEITLRQTLEFYSPAVPWVGIAIGLEWHLVWAAFSGMETVLYIFLVLAVMRLLLVDSRNDLLAGLLTGISIWVRPDGVTLLGPLTLGILLRKTSLAGRIRGLAGLALGFGVFFLPYLVFNLSVGAAPMPSTFYAKQAEYTSWQLSPLLNRLFLLSLQFFLGISLALIPGFILKMVKATRAFERGILLAAAWLAGYCVLYLTRLPVYQHGRYYMPALAVFLLIGFSGFIEGQFPFQKSHPGGFRLVSMASLVTILALSFVYGGRVYSQDVAYIEKQMVDTAKWVAKNVPTDAKVAAHDIGALGYFDRHPLVDLAGLISPEIVPIITNDQALSVFMKTHGVNYLVAFQGWKPALEKGVERIYLAPGEPSTPPGLGSMAVFQFSPQ